MKKMIVTALFVMGIGICSFAQYTPTKADIGKDCTTENGSLGTWKQVTVTESRGNSNSWSSTNSSSAGVNASVGFSGTSVGVSGNTGTANTRGNQTSTTTTRTYKDVQCVEDRNAKLPQQTPIRW